MRRRAAAASDRVHCYGINSCKGTADCKTANNACKGQGFKVISAAECLKQGGVIGDL